MEAKTITLTIDGKEYKAREGQTILEVARENGIFIPTLCYLEKLGPIGACRLCVVEVEGLKIPVTACTTHVKDGMVVRTRTDEVRAARRTALELLLSDHRGDCEAPTSRG